jgi:peroxiredoxin Q/BCP
MSLSAGDAAPDFTLENQHHQSVTLSELWKKGPVVLFFYPKDFTAGCTAEACAFRDAYDDFVRAGATVVGISSQSADSKKAFAEKHVLPFTLVADDGGKVRDRFGVARSFLGLVEGRETFIIDGQGRIQHVFNSQVNPTRHVKEALDVLARLKPAA